MLWSASTVQVAALLDHSMQPAHDIMHLVEERLPDDDFCVSRRELSRLFGAGELLRTPSRLSYQHHQLALRGTRDGQDETLAAVDVVAPPARAGAVVADCQSLQRVLREIPGDPVGISIGGDVLGGPGVRLWPYHDLPNGARLLYGLRGTVGD
jgi:hypothetical protein